MCPILETTIIVTFLDGEVPNQHNLNVMCTTERSRHCCILLLFRHLFSKAIQLVSLLIIRERFPIAVFVASFIRFPAFLAGIQIQAEIQEVSLALRESTKNLCRNLKDNPNISGNLLKIQRERTELIDLLNTSCRQIGEVWRDVM